MNNPIKAELIDLGPYNGRGEPDAAGSCHAFTLIDKGDTSDEQQELTFMIPAHQLPARTALDRLSGRVTAESLVDYFREHEKRLEHVRGFLYGFPGTRFFIRDYGLDTSNQVVWEKETGPDCLDDDRAEMFRQIEIYRFSLALAASATAPTPSPDQIRREALREAAEVVRPRGERPCDCESCYCSNPGDAQAVADWDAASARYNRILDLITGGDDAHSNP